MINYSIGEAQEVLNQGQIKDPYHRELFQWLIDQLRAVEEKAEPAATQQELIDALNMACGVTDELSGLGSEVKTATQQAALEAYKMNKGANAPLRYDGEGIADQVKEKAP